MDIMGLKKLILSRLGVVVEGAEEEHYREAFFKDMSGCVKNLEIYKNGYEENDMNEIWRLDLKGEVRWREEILRVNHIYRLFRCTNSFPSDFPGETQARVWRRQNNLCGQLFKNGTEGSELFVERTGQE